MADLLSSDPRVANLVDSIADIVVAPLRARVALLEAQPNCTPQERAEQNESRSET